MSAKEIIQVLEQEKATALMESLYGRAQAEENKKRYQAMVDGYVQTFGDGDIKLFSSPGRTEISGNHTDHNHGKVLAGSINLDCVGAAAKNDSRQIRIVSETYNQDFTIDLDHLEVSPKAAGTIDLVKGMLKGFESFGYQIGGFNAYLTSNVISAAGVSSSIRGRICTFKGIVRLKPQIPAAFNPLTASSKVSGLTSKARYT